MEYLCPQIDQLVACYTCGAQALPPYRLCLEAHVGCPPCAKYLPRCACGFEFTAGPHSTFDWLVSAMKLKCKYSNNDEHGSEGGSGVRESDGSSGETTSGGGNGDDCKDQWFEVQELKEHYRTGCTKNSYTCPLNGCGHIARVDTILDHYEAAHGPFVELTPNNTLRPYEVTFEISTLIRETVQKMFNGYFLFTVIPSQHRNTAQEPPTLSMQNINPSDPLRYTYDAMVLSMYNEITVTVTMVELCYEP